jgi:hypothetical protein
MRTGRAVSKMSRSGRALTPALAWLRGQVQWMEEHDHRDHHQRRQNEVARLQEMGLRHHPAPRVMKNGFETPDGKR